MIIDGNEKETKAMLAFNAGDKALAKKLEQEFLDEFKASGEDHCSCKAACRHHGNCVECVISHPGQMRTTVSKAVKHAVASLLSLRIATAMRRSNALHCRTPRLLKRNAPNGEV